MSVCFVLYVSYMKPHILFILDYFSPHRGGVETVFDNITKRLIDRGYLITILTSRFDPHLAVYEQYNGMDIYRVWSNRYTFMVSALYKGFLLMRRTFYSFIHSSTYWWALPSWILSVLFRKKVILTVHEVFWSLWFFYKWYIKGFFYWLAEFFLFLLPFDIYHTVSVYTTNCLRVLYGISDSRIHHIYNGVDREFWSPTAVSKNDISAWRKKYARSDRPVLLYYGHSWKSKWLDYLIQALPAIITQYPNILCVFNLIHAQRDKEMRKYIARLWYTKNVQVFSGFHLNDLRILLAASTLVVAPSLSEWFGSVHSEVSSMGIPLVTTHVASIPEVVYGNVHFVIPQNISTIVAAVSNILDQQNIQSVSMKDVFSWDKTVDHLENIYAYLYSLRW